jgi:hypothetical protein
MPIAEAILDARWRGVKIEAFVEQDYLKSKLKALPDRRRRRARRRNKR